MEYTKQTWTAPTGTGLSRYAKSAESASHVTLTLDPENLTNTPTPFTMARMAHMEDGIAKAYDTAPPTPWAQYSGKDIPQLPDNLAGTTYKRDNDWTTTDGWTTASGGVVSVDNNSIINTVSTALGYLTRGSTYGTGRLIILSYVAPKSGNVSLLGTLNGVPDTLIKTTPVVKGKEKLIVAYAPETLTSIYIFQSSLVSGDIMRITKCYIGTGAYDRLVFDNSYHYRHLLNNAVVPTPQGLYFNGATSYLRSKEPVTLPDVFTFSATVNCAEKTSDQIIFSCASAISSNGVFWLYRNANGSSIALAYYNINTSALAYTTIATNFFSGLDNTDVVVEVCFDFLTKTITVKRNNATFNTVTLQYFLKPTVAQYIVLGASYAYTQTLLGYMRNIQIYDTALTDTQRNWLAQGNTPPILYDVTNYETEGYVSIQDADGTNTGVETDVDSNGNRILKLPATIKASITGNADTATKLVTPEIETLRKAANFTLGTYADGKKLRIANTHATNTITCMLPTGQTMNGQSSFTIAPDTILEFELIGTAWKCISKELERIWMIPDPTSYISGDLTLSGSIEQFKFYEIVYAWGVTEGARHLVTTTGLMPIDRRALMMMSYGDKAWRPVTAISGTTLSIGTATIRNKDDVDTVLTGAIIPHYIYGMK